MGDRNLGEILLQLPELDHSPQSRDELERGAKLLAATSGAGKEYSPISTPRLLVESGVQK